jgi:membrane dipeptidase
LGQGSPVVVCATVIARCRPWVAPERLIRRDDLDHCHEDQAHAAAMAQMAYYHLLERRGEIRLLRTRADFAAHLAGGDRKVGVVVMMEGADPITAPGELAFWHGQGLRCLSLAHFGRSRYAAGTPSKDPAARAEMKDGPLSPLAAPLIAEMEKHGVILDMTHLGDASFAEAQAIVEKHPRLKVCASHSACRAITPGYRQLTDDQLRFILSRGGVVGIPMHREMLRPDGHAGEVGLAQVVAHIRHVCALAGNARQVGIGSDLDGGFGTELTPVEIERGRDQLKLADALAQAGFDAAAVAGVMGRNWVEFWAAAGE